MVSSNINPFCRKSFLAKAAVAILLSILPVTISAETALSAEEIVILRRIQEFWKDGDYGLAKTQIENYLSRHQGSALEEQLQAMLGDLYFNESLFKEALECYSRVQTAHLVSQVKSRKLHSLFQTKHYEEIVEELTPIISTIDLQSEERLLYSESLFRLFRREKAPEQKKLLAAKVKQNYEPLLEDKYREYALFALAETYKALHDFPKAADFYRSLSSRYPKQKGDFLFEVATMEAHYDALKAANTFHEIAQGGYSCSTKAKVNELVLKYHSKKYEDVVGTSPESLRDLSPQQRQIADLYIGKSYYNLSQYHQAAAVLRGFATDESKPTPYTKSALLQILDCARQIDDHALFDAAYKKFNRDFSQSSELPKIIAIHAQQGMQKQQFEEAKSDLLALKERFPQFRETESLFLELATAYGQTQDWKSARLTLLDFIRLFPDSQEQENAWNTLLAYSMKEVEAAPTVQRATKKEQLADDLTRALSADCFRNEEQKIQARVYLGKAWMEVGQFGKAADVFETTLKQPLEKARSGEVHTLLSQCCRELKKGNDFAKYAESALTFVEDQEVKTQLHLQLFNHYQFENQSSPEMTDKASSHLYAAVENGAMNVNLDNLVWLAHVFSAKAKSLSKSGLSANPFADRAKKVFEMITFPKNVQEFLENHPALLEVQTLRYSELLESLGDHHGATAIVETLYQKMNEQQSLPWSSSSEVALKLADLYFSAAENDKGIALLDQILDTSPKSSYFHKSALLEKSKAEIAQFHKMKVSRDDARWLNLLSVLKDLQIEKSFASEPLHLEAAIEYATLRTELYPEQERLERAPKLWQRVLFDFTDSSNPQLSSYELSKTAFPEKAKKIDLYLKFIEIKGKLAQAKLANLNEPSDVNQSEVGRIQGNLKSLLNEHPSAFLRKKIDDELSSL